MNDLLEIYVNRLGEEKVELIDVEMPPELLDVDEKDLQLENPAKVKGKAYLANDHLVLNLDVRTIAIVPCTICNDPVEVAITLDDFYYTEKLSDIKGATFDATGPIREAILLEVPQFVECGGKSCPRRAELAKYLTQKEAQFPFAELDQGE